LLGGVVLPRELFDGFGNTILAYSQAEIDAVKQELEDALVREELLKKQLKSRKKVAKKTVYPTRSVE